MVKDKGSTPRTVESIEETPLDNREFLNTVLWVEEVCGQRNLMEPAFN